MKTNTKTKTKTKSTINKGVHKKTYAEGMEKYAAILTGIYLFLILVVFPFFAPEGYVDIGEYKYKFFRLAGLLCFGLIIPAAIFIVLSKRKEASWKKLSLTDRAVLLYAVAAILSFICSDWQRQAWWGVEGWYMGLVSQIIFIVTYFCVSRYGEKIEQWYKVLLAVSAVVFLLGLLNRFSIYPISMRGANPGFISTLGNINWFCSYWVITFPIGLVLYWNKKQGKNVLFMLYIVLGFMTGITQGSGSGFLALGAVMLALFLTSFKEAERLLRWIELLLLFSVSVLCISVIKGWFPHLLNYQNSIEEWLTQYTVSVALFAVVLILYAFAHFYFRKKGMAVEKVKWLKWTVAGMAGAAVLVVLLLFLVFNLHSGMRENAEGIAENFVLDYDWGNGRGTTWKAGVDAYAKMDILHKLVGSGPDSFWLQVYNDADIASMLYEVFGEARLTNAHNEWLTTLVNIGLFGFLAYAAIFVTAIVRLWKNSAGKTILFVAAICILSYTVHNMVSFQQVICTPLVFIILGFGENSVRSASNAHAKGHFAKKH